VANNAKKYKKKLEQLLKQADKLDDAAVKRVLEILRQARKDVAAAIVHAGSFEQANQAAIERAIRNVFDEFARRYIVVLSEEQIKAWDLGQKLVDEPIRTLGIAAEIKLAALPQLSVELLSVMQGLTADLVTKVSDEARGVIMFEVRRALLSGQSITDVIKNIGGAITRGRFKTIADRAEFIARTETNRALNMATQLRGEQLAKAVVGVKKFWIHSADNRVRPSHEAVGRATNPAFGGAPIPINQKFTVGGYKAKGPHDPSLPANETINCRCRLGFVVPEEIAEEPQLTLNL